MKLSIIVPALALALAGCSYGGAAPLGPDRVVLTRNTGLGLGRKVFVCKVTNAGVTDCQAADSP